MKEMEELQAVLGELGIDGAQPEPEALESKKKKKKKDKPKTAGDADGVPVTDSQAEPVIPEAAEPLIVDAEGKSQVQSQLAG